MYIKNMTDNNFLTIVDNAKLGQIQGIFDINPSNPEKMVMVLDYNEPEKQLSYIFGNEGLVACIDYASYDYIKNGENNHTPEQIIKLLASDEKFIKADTEYQKIALKKFGKEYYEKLEQKYIALENKYDAEIAEIDKQIKKLRNQEVQNKSTKKIIDDLYFLREEAVERSCVVSVLDIILNEIYNPIISTQTTPPSER